MDDKKNEPQSYGSNEEWVTGETAQTVNRLKGPPNSQHSDFYESRHQPEEGTAATADPHENAQPEGAAHGAHDPVQKVTAKESGAKRQSYFKDRDYKG